MNAIAYALPDIEHEVNKMKRAIENSVMQEVHSGTLTPDKAMNKWLEWTAAHRLIQRMTQQLVNGKKEIK